MQNSSRLQNPLASLTHRERLGLALAAGVLALFGAGSALYRARAVPLEPTVFKASASPTPLAIKPSPPPASAPPTAPVELVVYVSGAVKHPGVYTFRQGQRLYQAIQKAGGFQKGAQEDALNLADRLKDADQIHVPVKAAAPTVALLGADPAKPSPRGSRVLGKRETQASPVTGAAAPTQASSQGSEKFHVPGDGTIKLNTATLSDLQKLPGVGPSTAQSILDYRKQSGGFQELEELMEVRGIGEKKLAKMRPFLSL